MGGVFKLGFFGWIIWFILSLVSKADEIKNVITAPMLVTQGVSVAVELRGIENMLVMYKMANEHLLPEDQFDQYVRDKFKSRLKDPLEDPWGKKYRYAHIPGGFALGSSGPDKKFQTEDDVIINWIE